ncbi:hypothetical protein V1504DRAFT_430634 [Lipomyces starkeyi]
MPGVILLRPSRCCGCQEAYTEGQEGEGSHRTRLLRVRRASLYPRLLQPRWKRSLLDGRNLVQSYRQHGAIKYFARLQQAYSHVNQTERAWAIDVQRTGSNGRNAGKSFLVCSPKALYEYMAQRPIPCHIYEIILTHALVAVFTEEDCATLINLLCAFIRDFIHRPFPEMTREACEDDRLVHVCDVKKFSLHYIHHSLYMANTQCSMLAFVYELQLFLRESLRRYAEEVGDAPAILNRAIEVGVVDLSVYRASQQFRLVGNTKLGMRRPLRAINVRG